MSRSQPPPSGELPSNTTTTAKRATSARNWLESILSKSATPNTFDPWTNNLFASTPLSGLRPTLISHGRALCYYRVPASVADEKGNWHLGAIATMIDDIGAAAIMSVVGEITISVDFSISVFSTAKIGDEVEIEAKVVESRGRLTMVEVEVRHVGDYRIVANSRQWMSFSRALHKSNMPLIKQGQDNVV